MPNNRKSLEPWLYDEVEFYPHQVEGVRQLAKMKNFLLADEMGLGKSLQALTVACVDIKRGWAEKILVVCPVTLKDNWSDEIEKFTRLPYLILGQELNSKGRIRKLGPEGRAKQLAEFANMPTPKILIVNYEQLVPHWQDLNGLGFEICITDEAHKVKNYKAKRTKAWLKLSTRRTFELTGTPMLNHVNELWPLLHKIDPSAYPKYWGFLNRYAVFGGFENKQIIGVKNQKELTERLNLVMVRRLKKDVLDLPEVQYIQRKVSLTEAQEKLYSQAEEELQVHIQSLDETIEIENALVKFLRLKEICGTTLKFTGKDESGKLDQAVEDAIEILGNGHKLVVFTQFRDVLEAFARRIEAHGKANPQEDFDIWELHGDVPTHERQGIKAEWANDPKPGILLGMLQISGEGLNMTAARHCFFLDKLFVPGMNQQAVDRLHRIGQDTTQPVQVFEYITRGTVESRVEQILRTKKKIFGSIVNDSDFKRKLLRALIEADDG